MERNYVKEEEEEDEEYKPQERRRKRERGASFLLFLIYGTSTYSCSVRINDFRMFSSSCRDNRQSSYMHSFVSFFLIPLSSCTYVRVSAVGNSD